MTLFDTVRGLSTITTPGAYGRVLVFYALLGVSMWAAPLLSIVHVESSAVVATAAFFAAGLSTFALIRSGLGTGRIFVLQELALLVPWLLLTVSAMWQPNCDYVRGILFFLIFPTVTVVFAVSMARLLHVLPVRRKESWLVAVGVLLVVVTPLYDVGFHPQFYTYNHVFGGILGPIYDEQLAVRPGLFAFRMLTLLWAALFLFAASWVEGKDTSLVRSGAAVTAACIAAAYLCAPSLGIVTTRGHIEEVLGGVERTRHFEIYYDPSHTTEDALGRLVDEHEYRYAHLQRVLGLDVEGPIRSYVYPNADVKARLTGARNTNVAPVWLPTPQTHVLASDFDAVFPHELVHVFSREFGLPIVRASVSVGLVEGLAVALQPPDGRPGPHEQVSAALLSGRLPGASREPIENLVDVVASHLSPVGFWTGRGAVSYTTMGSFVQYLIETYGPEPFVRAYATSAFEKHYGKPAAALAQEWTRHVLSLEAVGRSTADFVDARFSVPSLFEKECPHFVPPHRRRLIDAQRELGRGDSTAAYRIVSAADALESVYAPVLELWAKLALIRGEAGSVAERLGDPDRFPATVALLVRRGDALALVGRAEEARRSYDRARAVLPSFAHETRALVLLRRALAEDGVIVSALIGASDPGRPERIDGPAERLAIGLAMRRIGRYEQALDLMRTTTTSTISPVGAHLGGELARRRLFWLAELSYEYGSLADAAAYADSAESAYRDAGAFSEADVLRDFRGKMTWLATEQMDGIAEVRLKLRCSMTNTLQQHAAAALLGLFLVASGCASQQDGGTPERSAGPRAPASSPLYVEMGLAESEGSVQSIQLYHDGSEARLPVVELRSDDELTLEFDVMTGRGRPLSVYFYHADRTWRRDLSPGEFLASFQRDDLLEYELSRGTQVPYVHYTYRFPNADIDFLISGNYVVRVTEQGSEDEILLERAFFITEQSAALEFATDRVLVGDYGYPSIQPIARFRPPAGLEGNVFDYNVCFVRNGRLELARCSDRPSLANSPLMQFYLEPDVSFEPEEPPYFLDVSDLRASNQIATSDFSTSPYRIELEPDYARFGGSGVGPMLNGQSRISSVVRLGYADTEAEYVLARFAYVPPDEQRVGNEVLVTGSFNGWRYDRTNTLRWVSERGRYEGDVLLKQGQYEYRYVGRDRRLAQALSSNMPRPENQYTTFVYFDDASLNTDRLVAVRQAISE